MTLMTASRHAGRTARALGVAATVVTALTLAGCGGSSSSGDETSTGGSTGSGTVSTQPAGQGGTLRLARSIEPVTLNPIVCNLGCENGSIQTMAQIYDTLVVFDPGSDDAKPGLATSWDVSEDKKTYTFHLRPAKFSDGSPVTSADVEFSLGAIATPKSSYAALYDLIADVKAPDASTVVVSLKKPSLGFPSYLGFPVASIVSKDIYRRIGEKAYAKKPVGSGPFMLKRWEKGRVVELVRNPNHWRKGQPYLDAVELVYVPNDNTRTLDLLSGNVDAVDAVPFSQVDQVNKSGQAKVLFQDSSGMYPIWFNQKYKPLDEQVVRQALNYATPLEQIQKIVGAGSADVANAVMPKLKYWSKDIKPYSYDIEKAKQLMSKSSRPQGFPLNILITSGDATSKQVAQIVQQTWGELGVKVSVSQVEAGVLFERVATADSQSFMLLPDIYTSDLPIPDEFAQLLYNSLDADYANGWTWHDDPVSRKLADQATYATDEAERARLFVELQKRTLENPSAVPLIFPPFRGAYRSNVHGLQYVKTGWWRLEQVSLAR